MKNRSERLLVFAIIFLVLSGWNVLADVIRMRDGSVLKGKVVTFTDKKFTIIVKIGMAEARYVIPLEEIESVEFGEVEEVSPSVPRLSQGGQAGQGGEVARRSTRAPGAEPLAGSRPATSPGSAGRTVTREADRRTESGSGAGERVLAGVGETGAVLIEKKIDVPASAEWTSSGIRVQQGQRIVINVSGEVDLGDNRRTGPGGVKDLIESRRDLMTQYQTGGLLVVIGDDNDHYEFIGTSQEFNARHSGILFLLVNDRSQHDNSGSFVAQVKILSNK